MPASVEKTYATALFEIIAEESGAGVDNSVVFKKALDELGVVNDALVAAPELVKLTLTPTISREEKLNVIKSVFEGKLSGNIYNFIGVLTQKGRMGSYGRIFREFGAMYHEKFGIVPVTVTSAFAIDADMRSKIIAKMEKITGKKVELSEKVDKGVIGGVVVDYGGTRIDASVKTRLENLKKEIAEIVL